MNTATREEVYETVYRHLTELYKHMYFGIYNIHNLSEQDKAIISYTAYQELIQMAQMGQLNSYYERIRKDAV